MISSSPIQDIMSTPHFQLKKLRKELAEEGDIRDELEKELANHISIISEKGISDFILVVFDVVRLFLVSLKCFCLWHTEGLISQLQHRVERLLREQGQLEKDHKAALLELQEKNER